MPSCTKQESEVCFDDILEFFGSIYLPTEPEAGMELPHSFYYIDVTFES